MKKSILFAALAASLMTVTSCTSTNNEELSATGAISFSPTLNKSRALTSVDDLTKFYVYGSVDGKSIFSDQLVSRPNTAADWTYTYNGGEAPKWVVGSTHYFYAYSADNGKLEGKMGSASYTPSGKLVFTNVYAGAPDSNFDLVYASAEQVGKMTDNAKVAFRFKHILSQINVIFKNVTTNNNNVAYNVKVNSINFANCEVMGNFDGEKWTEPSNSTIPGLGLNGTPLYFADNNLTSTDYFGINETKQTVSMYEIPYDYSYEPIVLRFSVTITNANDPADTKTKTLQATFNPNWQMGYRYNYTIPVSLFESDEYIQFTAESLDDWSEGATSGTLKIEEVK